MKRHAAAALLLTAWSGTARASDVITDWQASAGRPTAVSPPWAEYGTPGTITDGALSIGDNNGYYQDETVRPGFDLSGGFSVEARLRYVSGATFRDSRDVAGLLMVQRDSYGNTLYIGDGRVFLLAGVLVRGATAFVDTRGFHTYRIDFGAQNGGSAAVSVFYDGALLLTGSTYSSVADNGTVQQMTFGDISGAAAGVTEWQFVRDAVSGVPEPSSWAAMVLGLGAAGAALRRRPAARPSTA